MTRRRPTQRAIIIDLLEKHGLITPIDVEDLAGIDRRCAAVTLHRLYCDGHVKRSRPARPGAGTGRTPFLYELARKH
jgi:hypothetical protein